MEGIGVLLNGKGAILQFHGDLPLDYYAILLRKMKWIPLYQEVRSIQ